jgi:protoporphyrinogen oxidase
LVGSWFLILGSRMNIAIIGGGFAGLTAAHDLLTAGQQVTVFEAAPQVGGLASGFKAEGWEWALERFYHHIFKTDKEIIALANAIGAAELIFWNRPTTAYFYAHDDIHAFDSPLAVLTFPYLPFIDRLRVGIAAAVLKLRHDWRRLEHETAEQYLLRWMGRRAYAQLWEPLLVGKFGPYAKEVNAAWIWARIKSRTRQLGYIKGGFQAFADALAAQIMQQGGVIRTGCPIRWMECTVQQWMLWADGEEQSFDRVIVASSPATLAKLVPALPKAYLRELQALKSLGAVVMVVALDRQLLTNGVYWLNLSKHQFPFLALVEHTNMIAPHHYGGDRLVYCGDYLPADHRYFKLPHEEVQQEWLAALPQANPHFQQSWVKQSWLFREPYAQPVVPVHHSRHLPPLRTPLDGLCFASMSQVYPWDRGTNFAVELGHRVAREVLEEPRTEN